MLKIIKDADKDIDIDNKRVLLRVDFNVPLSKKGVIEDDFRIRQAIPTIKYLINNKAKIIVISHLGNPKYDKNGKIFFRTKSEKGKYTLGPVAKRLAELLGRKVNFLDNCVGRKVEERTKKIKRSDILFLENLRFHKEEEENNQEFAKSLAALGDIYVNDAFGSCHRLHASIVGVPKYLPSFGGLLLGKEVRALSKIIEKPKRPLVIIIGGAKILSKIKVVNYFMKKADHLLVGGKISNTILTVKGICPGRTWPPEDIVSEIESANLTSTKLHLPLDAVVSPNEEGNVYVRKSAIGSVKKDELILDIGPETIKMFSRIIKSAETIVWAGPLGFFEKPLFEKGTKLIAESIVNNDNAFKVAGGGDTIFALSKFHLRDKFNHVSTGGGAMLSFLSGEKLPGIEALKNNKN